MSQDADPLFPDYRLYGPYVFKIHGRKMVHMIRKSDRHRLTLTWARYKMCLHLGRVLETSEEVDHVDDDPHNDDLDNLQILTRSENVSKSSGRNGSVWLRLCCPGCGKSFEKPRNTTHVVKTKNTYTACSRRCSGIVSRKFKRGEDLSEALSRNIGESFVVYKDWKIQ